MEEFSTGQPVTRTSVLWTNVLQDLSIHVGLGSEIGYVFAKQGFAAFVCELGKGTWGCVKHGRFLTG